MQIVKYIIIAAVYSQLIDLQRKIMLAADMRKEKLFTIHTICHKSYIF